MVEFHHDEASVYFIYNQTFCSNKHIQTNRWYFVFDPFQQTVTRLCLSYIFIIEKFRQDVCFNCLYTFLSQWVFYSNLKYKSYGEDRDKSSCDIEKNKS